MSADLALPPGFAVLGTGPTHLVAPASRLAALARAGFDRPETWQQHLTGPAQAAGRGTTAQIEVDGIQARLKQLRRGGMTARVWRERFPGRRRLLDNLRLPLAAGLRAVPTAEPLALLLLEGPRGLYRGWLAVREIEGARDLLAALRSASPPTREELAVVLAVVRQMHDAGIEHRDLNLGNLLLKRDGSRAPTAFVIDLDAARLHARPLGPRLRRRSLARLDRSYRKMLGAPSPVSTTWCDLYAAGDATLRRAL